MRLIAGWKVGLIVAIVLAVGWISYSTIQFVEDGTKDKVTIGIQQKQNKVRKEIKEAVEDQKSKTVKEALEYLEGRDK